MTRKFSRKNNNIKLLGCENIFAGPCHQVMTCVVHAFWAVSVGCVNVKSVAPAFEESLQLAARYFKKESIFSRHFLVHITQPILSKHNISQKQ